MFITRLYEDGTLNWSKVLSTDVYTAHDVIATSDGGFAVSGRYDTGSDAFLAKFGSNGTLSWIKTFGNVSPDQDVAYSLIQSDDGGYVLTGSIENNTTRKHYATLIKFNSEGSYLWGKKLGSGVADKANYSRDLAQTNDGGYVVVGSTTNYGAGGYDVFISKFSSIGTLIWTKTLGGAGGDLGQIIINTANESFAIAGMFVHNDAKGDALFAMLNADGTIDGCLSPMCQSPLATVTDYSPPVVLRAPAVVDVVPGIVTIDFAPLQFTPTATQTPILP